jgi:chromosome segregation ATPase
MSGDRNNQRWQKMFNQWQQEKTTLANEKLTLEQALEFAHKENQSLHGKYDGLLQQLQEKQERIEELHRLHQQTQANLEHYRESAREQRLLDQQQFEQQKQQFQFEIKNLNEQAVMQRDKITELKHQNQLLQQSYLVLESTNKEINTQLQQVTIQLEEVEKSKIELIHSNQQLQSQYYVSQEKLNENVNKFTDLQIEIKLLSQKLTEKEQFLMTLQDQNKLLTHEKWIIGQEKAQLEGQLKQFQKTIIA